METNNFKQKKINRFSELDAFRGLAVLSVILLHYTHGYDFHFNLLSKKKFYFEYGYLAVELFFIISGFVISLTLDKSKTKTDFIVSRFSRLYPTYWASMVVTLVFLSIFPIPTLGNYTLHEILLNITMFQGFSKIRLVDQVYWTLKIELTFYILMYILYLCKLIKYIIPISFAWLALAFTSFYFLPVSISKYLDVLFILSYCSLFIAGINFYRIKTNNYTFVNHVQILTCFVVQVFYLKKLYPITNIPSVTVFVFFVFFYLFSYNKLGIFNNKFLLFFGNISYSLYLLHNVIGYSIIYHLRKYTDIEFIYVSIPFVISILLAVLMTNYIERPAINYIRSVYKNKMERTYSLSSNH